MTRPDIKNLNDLNDYLTLLEELIAVLEQEDRTIKGAINEVNHNLQYNNQPADLPPPGCLAEISSPVPSQSGGIILWRVSSSGCF